MIRWGCGYQKRLLAPKAEHEAVRFAERRRPPPAGINRGVSKIAKGRFAKALVLRGSKEKTVGGLRRDSLMKNNRGKVVSKRASAAGIRRYGQIEDWGQALMAARAALRVTGFVAVNGKSIQG